MGSERVATCRCVAQLPTAGGASAISDTAGAGGELPAAPDPYPGAGCPLEPSEVSSACGCQLSSPCVYADFSLCCSDHRGEDCGATWVHCE